MTQPSDTTHAIRAGYGVIPCAVMDRTDLSIYAKMLYAALSSFAGLREIRPGHKRLAEIVGCSERKIRDALDELKTNELVEWKTVATQTGKISIYRSVTPWTEGPAQDAGPVRHETTGGPAHGAGEVTKEVTRKTHTSASADESAETTDGSPSSSADLFEDFWAKYPRTKDVSKKVARQKFALAARATPPAEIVAAAGRFADLCAAEGTREQFIAHPSTWLNQERYKIEILQPEYEPEPAQTQSWW